MDHFIFETKFLKNGVGMHEVIKVAYDDELVLKMSPFTVHF